ncbi:hypothetical protein HDU96_006269 [Phlyctochytrium bullatum]|nr:hypothetical protein HDU96_006269 [Phlyctochytrium bullatum]
MNKLVNKNFTKSKRKLIIACYIAIFTVAAGGVAFKYMEDWDFASSYSFCVVTLTIGYGNVSPKTLWGRVFLFVYFIVGTLNTGYLVSSIQDLAVEKTNAEVQRAVRWRKLRTELRRARRRERDRRLTTQNLITPPDSCPQSFLQYVSAQTQAFFSRGLDPTNYSETISPWQRFWRKYRKEERQKGTKNLDGEESEDAVGNSPVTVVVTEHQETETPPRRHSTPGSNHRGRPTLGTTIPFLEPSTPLAAAVEAAIEAEADFEAELNQRKEKEREHKAVEAAIAAAKNRRREAKSGLDEYVEDGDKDEEDFNGIDPIRLLSESSLTVGDQERTEIDDTHDTSVPVFTGASADIATNSNQSLNADSNVEADFAEDQKIQSRFAAIRFRRTIIAFLIFWLCTARGFEALEPQWNYLDAVYFTFCTFSTIGYGDLYPTTPWSWELLQVFLFASIAEFAMLLGILTESVASNLATSAMMAQARVEAERRRKEEELEKRIQKMAAEAAQMALASDKDRNLHPHYHRRKSLLDAVNDLKRRSVEKMRRLSGSYPPSRSLSPVSLASLSSPNFVVHRVVSSSDHEGECALSGTSMRETSPSPQPPAVPNSSELLVAPPRSAAPHDSDFKITTATAADTRISSGHGPGHPYLLVEYETGTADSTGSKPRFRGIKGWAGSGSRGRGIGG